MNLALLVVFIAALVATVGTLAWELATNFGRTPRFGADPCEESSSWT